MSNDLYCTYTEQGANDMSDVEFEQEIAEALSDDRGRPSLTDFLVKIGLVHTRERAQFIIVVTSVFILLASIIMIRVDSETETFVEDTGFIIPARDL